MNGSQDRAIIIQKIAELEGELARIRASAIDNVNAFFSGDHAKLKAQIATLKESLKQLEPEDNQQPERDPIHWTGTDTDLVDLFLTLKERHLIEASSEYAVFQMIVKHFVGKDLKPFKRANLKELAKKREVSGNSPFGSIPYATD